MKALIVDSFSLSSIEKLKNEGIEIVYDPKLNGDSLTRALEEEKPEILVVRSTKVQVPQLNAGLPILKVVIRAGSGYDTIDTKGAAERGVAVCNTPGMNSTAVAELVFAHILSFDRAIVDNVVKFREGQWCKGTYSKCRGIKGTTLGIVGFGSIGKLVNIRAKAFEMNVIVYDPFVPKSEIESYGVKCVDLESLARESDYISLHVLGGESTKNLINSRFLSLMKQGAVIINTSRSSVVNEDDLIAAVKEKGIYALVDVISNEPVEKKCTFHHSFAGIPNIFVTHHIGASTLEAENAIGEEATIMISTYAKEQKILHQVN